MASPDIQAALARLRLAVGAQHVLTAPGDVAAFATDWKGTTTGQPLCVVRPGSTAEVVAIVEICRELGLSIVPQGGNTGLAAGAVPDKSGLQVVCSLARNNKVRRIDPIGMTMEVEAGCVLRVAQEAARDAGRLLPISLAAEGTAQIGGIIATNAGGLNVLRYGMARGFVLGLEVVLADGTVLDGMRHLRKDNAGFDWKQLFVGCEGTLGIITSAVLRLTPLLKHRGTALLAVENLDDALALLSQVQDHLGDVISSFELLSAQSLSLVAAHFEAQPPFDSDWYVLIEAGASLPGLAEGFEAALTYALERGHAQDAVIAQSEDQAARLWRLRELITESEHKAGGTIKHDVSVPIDCIPAFVSDAAAALRCAIPGMRISIFGHLGDGNLHFNVLPEPGIDRAAITRIVHDLVHAYAGSISAEHGIGSYRIDELPRYKSAVEIATATTVKRALDPYHILNPGKVLHLPG